MLATPGRAPVPRSLMAMGGTHKLPIKADVRTAIAK